MRMSNNKQGQQQQKNKNFLIDSPIPMEPKTEKKPTPL